MRIVLGIESSCDETAVALVREDRVILSQALATQQAGHAPYGGVVPEIAARAHLGQDEFGLVARRRAGRPRGLGGPGPAPGGDPGVGASSGFPQGVWTSCGKGGWSLRKTSRAETGHGPSETKI